jgi:hypothetical protein
MHLKFMTLPHPSLNGGLWPSASVVNVNASSVRHEESFLRVIVLRLKKGHRPLQHLNAVLLDKGDAVNVSDSNVKLSNHPGQLLEHLDWLLANVNPCLHTNMIIALTGWTLTSCHNPKILLIISMPVFHNTSLLHRNSLVQFHSNSSFLLLFALTFLLRDGHMLSQTHVMI